MPFSCSSSFSWTFCAHHFPVGPDSDIDFAELELIVDIEAAPGIEADIANFAEMTADIEDDIANFAGRVADIEAASGDEAEEADKAQNPG